jgi:hypothetical protein
MKLNLGLNAKWRLKAACREHDTPDSVHSTFCAACPVWGDCVNDALRVEAGQPKWAFHYTRGVNAYDRHTLLANNDNDPARAYAEAQLRLPTRVTHATTSAYTRGCRCDPCRLAMSEYHAKRRKMVTA